MNRIHILKDHICRLFDIHLMKVLLNMQLIEWKWQVLGFDNVLPLLNLWMNIVLLFLTVLLSLQLWIPIHIASILISAPCTTSIAWKIQHACQQKESVIGLFCVIQYSDLLQFLHTSLHKDSTKSLKQKNSTSNTTLFLPLHQPHLFIPLLLPSLFLLPFHVFSSSFFTSIK